MSSSHSQQLHALRAEAHTILLGVDRPLTPQGLARRLFGARRHEDPVAAIVVRHLLQDDPRFVRTHAGRWSAAMAPHLSRPLADATFAVVDLETTGSVLGVDEVIEIGALLVRAGRIERRLCTLVRSARPLPLWIRRLTGIRSADLQAAPPFPEVAAELADLLGGAIFVAHDLRFDLPFLRWEFIRHGLVMPEVLGLCTLQLSRLVWPELESRRLADLSRHFGVTHAQPHRAHADAEATAEILSRALARATQMGLGELGDLYAAPPVADVARLDVSAALAAEAAG